MAVCRWGCRQRIICGEALAAAVHDIDDSHAEVRFNACYKVNGRAHKMQENSRFVREQEAWLYVDGDVDGE